MVGKGKVVPGHAILPDCNCISVKVIELAGSSVFGYLLIVADVDGASCNRVTGQQLCVPPLLVRPIDKIHPEVFARILSSLSH